jgi:hypothetical protein
MMAARLKVEQIVTDAHWPSFQRMITHRSATINSGRLWLLRRGYRVSAKAVWSYMRHNRRALKLGSDAAVRRQLGIWAKQLHGKDLHAVATLAAFMVGEVAGIGAVRTPK